MGVIAIYNDAHARTPMAVHQTLLSQVGEMTTVITPGDPITPIGVGIMSIGGQDVGHILKEHITIAEGTRNFLLMNQKMKSLIWKSTMASPTKLPTKTKSCDKFTR